MGKRTAQQEFKGEGFQRPQDSFGGELKSNPKTARPLDSRLPIHLTLRASKSILRTPKTFGIVEKLIQEVAKKHGVRIYKHANVGNHIHLVIKIPRVGRWAAFIRELTGRMALALRHLMDEQKLWLFRPHTRIVRGWKKAFEIVKEYITLNQWEAEGHISRKHIKNLKDMRAIFDG